MTLHIGQEFHDQRTDAWAEARLGRITASKIYDVMAKTAKGAYTSKRDDYAYQLAAERMTGLPTRVFVNEAMQWGTAVEPEALEFYAEYYGYEVKQAPFIIHRDMAFAGASPDGIVNDEFLVEIKCLQTNTFLRVRIDGFPPPQYVAQCMMQMAVTQAPRVDLFVYDPRIIDPTKQFQLFVIERDEDAIANIENELVLFNDYVESIVNA